jgi:hypothetical protein
VATGPCEVILVDMHIPGHLIGDGQDGTIRERSRNVLNAVLFGNISAGRIEIHAYVEGVRVDLERDDKVIARPTPAEPRSRLRIIDDDPVRIPEQCARRCPSVG